VHDRAILLRTEVWAHKTGLTPPLFIEVSVPTQDSERSCICVLWISILPLSTILRLDVGTLCNKMKNTTHNTVKTFTKFNRKIVGTETQSTHITNKHDRSLSWYVQPLQ